MASSSTTVRAAREPTFTTAAMSFQALGVMTGRMVAAFTCFPMDPSTMAGGKITTFMERVFSPLPMGLDIRVSFLTIKSMAKENLRGHLGITIPDPSTTISSAALAPCDTLLATYTLVSGEATKKMARVASSSLTATSTKVQLVLIVTGEMATM